MKKLGIYSTDEFCQHIDELIHDTEKGNLALITKHDSPTFLTIPFDERFAHIRHKQGSGNPPV